MGDYEGVEVVEEDCLNQAMAEFEELNEQGVPIFFAASTVSKIHWGHGVVPGRGNL